MELIPNGNDNARSDDITIAAGDPPVLIFLKDDNGGQVPTEASVLIQAKADALYFTIGKIDGGDPAKVIDAPGTYSVLRPGCQVAFGVERG